MKQATEPGIAPAKYCVNLLEKLQTEESSCKSKLLRFLGKGENDVYNISRPFRTNNKIVIAGRVEKREDWAKSHIAFFERAGKTTWKIMDQAPILKMEDPFITILGEEIILGGVEVYTVNNKFDSNEIGYKTVFYRGKDIFSLKKFAQGPDKMKDIRFTPLANEKIGVCTRPQGGQYCRGQIGYITISRIEELNNENLLQGAKIIDLFFSSNAWGGANELHALRDGKIGILGHIAYEDDNNRKHYYAITFVHDPITHETSPVEILATRKNFPRADSKKPELEDIVFPGGLLRHDNGYATLYAGLSDAHAGYITLPDPFKDFC